MTMFLSSSILIFLAATKAKAEMKTEYEYSVNNDGGTADDIYEATNLHNDSNSSATQKESKKCTVYLAPSSIPGAGMGMYTTAPVLKSHIILPADGPSIPIIDPDNDPDSSTSSRSRQAWINLFSGYWWEHGSNVHTMFESDEAVDYQITMGALPNSHPVLDNLDAGHPSVIPYDDSLVPKDHHGRVVDPGAGAFSYYMGRNSIATRDIEAGEEIFLDYPSDYMDWISEKYGIPKTSDYEEAAEHLSTFLKLFEGSKLGHSIEEGEGEGDQATLAVPLVWSGSEHVKALLPKSQSELDQILISSKHSYDPADLTHAIAKTLSVQKRTTEWIEQNGICLENIMPGPSTIDTGTQSGSAGKGAIAQRQLPKGSVIAPASLLQITDRDALRMPAFGETSNQFQLLLNYCFGRDDSSLLLCPNTNAILINHCSSRRPDLHPCAVKDQVTDDEEEDREGALGPNAEYKWAKWDHSTEHWLNKTIDEMKVMEGRGLSFEIVATREIREGEEVFIDYGESWELAWDLHLEQWNNDDIDASPGNTEVGWKSAKEWNEELGPIQPTGDFSERNGGLLFTGCLYSEEEDADSDDFDDEEWKHLSAAQIMQIYSTPADGNFAMDESLKYTDDSFWPCVVVEREESNVDIYTVRIMQSPLNDLAKWDLLDQPRVITNYPRASIRHFYKPYQSDLHLPNAFRHHIELRDELTPEHWKNRQ